jgi:hypothetical protein
MTAQRVILEDVSVQLQSVIQVFEIDPYLPSNKQKE